MNKVKTPYDLKRLHEQHVPDSYFFNSDTLKFFGDTMENYEIKTTSNYYILVRKRPVKNGLNSCAYFDKQTFKRVYSPSVKQG